jgi:predicted RNA binding protein YcfA (HicA-like mRNA interferase family)
MAMSSWVQRVRNVMPNRDKVLAKVLYGSADANIAFVDVCQLLRRLGFDERVRGSHHIFTRDDVADILNLQPQGSKAVKCRPK